MVHASFLPFNAFNFIIFPRGSGAIASPRSSRNKSRDSNLDTYQIRYIIKIRFIAFYFVPRYFYFGNKLLLGDRNVFQIKELFGRAEKPRSV